MNRFIRTSHLALLALAVALAASGCKSNESQNAATTPDSSDPASVNQAPAATTDQSSTTSSSAPTAPTATSSGTQTADNGSYDTSSANIDDAGYGEEPVATAQEPPPQLPEYQQPVDPGDGYIWTPGYWNYASSGYYWVPGVWVQAPYQGALWTPGYWGRTHGHYGFFHGYWGPHIGFYGGINYGFGYVGRGYQGGYWNGEHFFYNRTVNNINVTVVHNVYEYRVEQPSVHISFNGGPGGVAVRPRPAEVAAFREPHAPPMSTQVQVQQAASTNRAQFVSENHGRPATPVMEKPVNADREVRPVAAPAPRAMTPEQHAPATNGKPAPRTEQRPTPQNEARPAPQVQSHPAPETRMHPAPQVQSRPAPQTQVHPAPPAPSHPAPRTEARPAPEVQSHPAPRPESHPAPQPQVHQAPRTEQHPGPAPKPGSHPETKPKPEDEHPR